MNASYPTTSSAPAVGSVVSGSGRSSQTSEFSSTSRWRSSNKSASGPGAYSSVVLPGGQMRPCALASAPGATTALGLPRRLQHLASLPHGDVVCAVTIGPCPIGRASSVSAALDICRGAAATAVSDTDSLTGSPNSAALSSSTTGVIHFAYTGARGSVKLWDLTSISASALSGPSSRDLSPLATFDCLCSDSYVRSIKLFPDASHLIIGGESNSLTLWDLAGSGRRKAELTFDAPACYALALSTNGKLCYSCCSDGFVSVWDVHNQSVVHQFHGHVDGTSCVELSADGNRLWTGGLDHKVCCWDIRGNPSRPLHHIEFKSQVFSLGLTATHGPVLHGSTFGSRRQTASVSPSRSADGDSASSGGGVLRDTSSPQSTGGGGGSSSSTKASHWLAVGLESSEVEVVAIGPDGPAPIHSSNVGVSRGDEISPNMSPLSISSSTIAQPQHFRLTHHESCVLALRFAHHGDWFLTTGKDHQVNAWRTPYGACLLETKEAASVLTCDISPDDKFVVTGSGDKRANLYEVIFVA
ncbi:Transducin enhancer protein 3 [Fasciola gigantica]|uniref:Transducin enhancer protein 3 n=1 Tax=Fasciola gigantica TaxID=46835 RepID=A0A504YQ53_FASGI|nr:Transducin enhancer protein 3 [Fasciola gigantica]